ncbi:olfactory receptor 5V1-like [Lissotriton helveticus]
MNKPNLNSSAGFLIVGFSDFPQLQVPIFVALLLIYFITIIGNMLIVTIIHSNPNLHTAMYFFLTHLAFVDIFSTSVIVPQLLVHFFAKGMQVSLTNCILQLYIFMAMATIELLLLAVMAYDRYVAICDPLRYTTIMNKAVCMKLAAGSWTAGFLLVIPQNVLMSRFHFCESHIINHIFCDMTALLKMSCSSTRITENLNFVEGSLVTTTTFIIIIMSYCKIVASILKIKSKSGKEKAFSTCASHITVVLLFNVSLLSTYVRPKSTYSMIENKIMSLSYVAVTPLCNPIIYSLKNAEFKKALKKAKRIA